VVVDPFAELVLPLSAPPAAAAVVVVVLLAAVAVDVLLPVPVDAVIPTDPLLLPPPHERRSATNRGDKLLSQNLVVMI
jgi:hypothetical protein